MAFSFRAADALQQRGALGTAALQLLLSAGAAAPPAAPLLRPSLLLPLLRPPVAAELSAAAASAMTQLLLQLPQPHTQESQLAGGADGKEASEQQSVRVRLSAGNGDGPVSLSLQLVGHEPADAAAAAAAPVAEDEWAAVQNVRRLPTDVLAALAAALERPDAPAVRAAAAAALRVVVAAAAAGHVSNLRPQGTEAPAAQQLGANSTAATEAAGGPVTVRLEVLEAGDSSGAAAAGVRLTLRLHSSGSQGGADAAATAAMFLDLQPSQLADIAAAAAQAASDVDAVTAAAAAALLSDLAAPTALMATDAALQQRLQEPAWRVQVLLFCKGVLITAALQQSFAPVTFC